MRRFFTTTACRPRLEQITRYSDRLEADYCCLFIFDRTDVARQKL